MRNQDDLFDEQTKSVPSLYQARTVEEVLRRTGGTELISWLRSLGFWADETAGRRAAKVPQKYSTLNDMAGHQLGDALAEWSSEYARATEILGVLQAERIRLKLALDRTGAEAALRILKEKKEEGEKIPTQRILDTLVSMDKRYQEEEDRLALIDQAIKAVSGVKEAAQGIRDGISREITRRGDMMRGRLE